MERTMAGKALPLSRLYVDGASVDHHRFGPYPPLQENMKKLKDTLMTKPAK
jgi:thiosulfate dehydrogenase